MNPIQKLIEDLNNIIIEALQQAKTEGLLDFQTIPEFVIEVPKDSGHGDFASNVAMLMAREARMAPRKIAEIISAGIDPLKIESLEKVEVAEPGLLISF